MARFEILDKLSGELRKEITSELQVVYILSKIRKFLEWENKQGEYKTLNFYCNWVLHSKIDRAEPVSKILTEFIENEEQRYRFLLHEEFIGELYKFLTKYELPLLSQGNLHSFINGLNEAISESPVDVIIDAPYRVILRYDRDMDPANGVSYRIVRI